MPYGHERFRYFSLIDGASLTDEDTAGNPEYFGYTRPGGYGIILRHNTTTNKYDFALTADLDGTLTKYDDAWTNRATITYKRAGELPHR